jgi:threonyl-tRNA synthetase
MNDMRVHIKDLAWGHVRAGATVGEALEQLGSAVAGHALAAKVDGREVDLGCRLEPPDEAGDPVVEIEPILPGTLEGLGVLRHSTAHLLAAAVLELFPGTKLGIGPALLDDPRFGFFYDVIAPRPLTDADLPAIEGRMRELAERGLACRREELPKVEALRLFSER